VNRLRLALLVALLIAMVTAAHMSGMSSHFSRAELRAMIGHAGPWGLALFAAAFAAGAMIYVPGLLFVAVAVLAWGKLVGGCYAYVGAMTAATVSFALVRGVGGRPLAEVRNPRVRAILARLDERPVLIVAALRALFLAAPAINYALALSPLRARQYLIGTAIGLVPSVAVMSSLFGIVFD
jgi:uncharacterized membrane protein YdjX (TVP38/TMEM64 family)